jgi:hypothetical protein
MVNACKYFSRQCGSRELPEDYVLPDSDASFLLYRDLPEPNPWWVGVCPSLLQAFPPLFLPTTYLLTITCPEFMAKT